MQILKNAFKKESYIRKSHNLSCRTKLEFFWIISNIFFLLLCLHQFFNQVLMLGKTSVSDLSEHVFDLILELYNIDSHLLLSVLPQLEFKLKVSKNFQVNVEAPYCIMNFQACNISS